MAGQLCHMCNSELDVPLTQYRCGHAYHQFCLAAVPGAGTAAHCVRCTPDAATKETLLKERQQLLLNLSLGDFARSVEAADSIQIATASYLGRGLLSRNIMFSNTS